MSQMTTRMPAAARGQSVARRRSGRRPESGPRTVRAGNQDRLPEWHFERQRPSGVARDPVSAEFFNAADAIRNDREALVRESIQNSLDNHDGSDEPVLVRFTLSGEEAALPPEIAGRYFPGLGRHLESCTGSAGVIKETCRFIVVEDFNTHGLRGSPASDENPGGTRNDFAYFFWKEGRSGKGRKEGGRWGIGKYVFPMASRIFTYFGYTVRAADPDDEGSGLLLGGATLKNHKLGDEGFEPDGRWGVQPDSVGRLLPHKSPAVIRAFRKDWGVTREESEPGLTVVVPYVDENWTRSHILEAALEEYFVAILDGRLVIEVVDLATGERDTLDPDGIVKLAEKIPDEDRRAQVISDIELVKWSRGAPEHRLDTKFPKRSWATAEYSTVSVENARAALEEETRVQVIVDVPVERKTSVAERGEVRLLLEKRDGYTGRPLFVRSGIEVKSAVPHKTHGTRVIAMANEPVLGEMLGDAEGPAHVKWSANTRDFKEKYKYGANALTIVRQTPSQAIKLIEGLGESRDFTVAKDFFSVPDTRRPGRRGGKPPKPPGPGKRSPDRVRKEPLPDGFRLSLAQGVSPKQMKVVIGYGRSRGNPFSSWSPSDFSLDGSGSGRRIRITKRSCKVTRMDNEILITDIKPGRFRLDVTGFDVKRDVAVSWTLT